VAVGYFFKKLVFNRGEIGKFPEYIGEGIFLGFKNRIG